MMDIKLVVESFDRYSPPCKEEVKGKFIYDSDEKRCSYNSELGFCEIIFEKEKVVMRREGKNRVELFFNSLGNGECKIKNEYFEKTLFIKNGNIKMEKGSLELSYELYDLEEQFNSLIVKIVKI